MSYPEPRYLGEGGEANATLRSSGQVPDFSYANGNTVHYLATGASTYGLFGLYRWDMSPKPSGARPHFHRTIQESFFRDFEGTVRLPEMSEEEQAAFYQRHDNNLI